MRCELIWSQCPAGEMKAPVSGICATKQRDRVYSAAGGVVQVMDRQGQQLKILETQHSEISHIVAHPTEEKIVTVGLDSQVVFMDTSGTPLFKYGHNTEVQCCAFSPDGQNFLTGADGDIGVYSNGAQRVNKIRVDSLVRSVAWSPSSKWFVIGTNTGSLIFMDLQGKVFNRCEAGAPIWHMKVVYKDVVEQQQKEDGPIGAVKNEVGVYQGTVPEQKVQPELKKKLDQTAEQFIKEVKAHEERLLFVSWDQKYRVINPGSLSHSGVLVEMKRNFSGNRRKRLQSNENPFLLAEARLPFIPLCFEFFHDSYVLVSGVGGKVSILAADTGACLMDMYQLSDLDPLISGAPRSKVLSGPQPTHHRPQQNNNSENTLSYFGLNSIWVFSMCLLTPDLLVLGLQRGVTVGLSIRHKSLDSGFRSVLAAREGLTNVTIRDVQTGSFGRLQLQTYVCGLAVSQRLLLVQTPGKLDIYELRDAAKSRAVLAEDGIMPEQIIGSTKIELKWIKQHNVSFRSRFMGVCTEHFILGGRDFVAAFDLEGQCITSWRFKDTQINCMRMIGGAPGSESVVLGTQDGRVLALRIGSRFAVEAVRHILPIHQVDVSVDRSAVAVIDSAQRLTVYEFLSGGRPGQSGYSTSLYAVPGAKSAVFDQRLPDVLAVSHGARLSVVVQGSILYSHTLPQSVRVLVQDGGRNYAVADQSQGSDVDIKNQSGTGFVTEIPLTPNVTYRLKRAYQFMAKGLWEIGTLRDELCQALEAAALGVPGQFYKDIAAAALFAGQVDYAEEGLARVGDVRGLKLLAEVEHALSGPENDSKRKYARAALALVLSDNYSDAALLRAAYGDVNGALELLYFVRQDGQVRIGPYTSLISAITQQLTGELLSEASKHGTNTTNIDLRPLPNLALYFRLGTSDDEIQRFRQEMLRGQMEKAGSQNSKYLEYLQIYDQTSSSTSQESKNNANNAIGGYQYNQDYRIMLRRELQTICPTQGGKQEILIKHAQFLEKISDWQAAAASFLDCGECERAVRVLIASEQIGPLLGLIRALPPVGAQNGPSEKDVIQLDLDFETGNSASDNGPLSKQQIINSLQLALQFFEARGDLESALLTAQRLGDPKALLRLFAGHGLWDAAEALGEQWPELGAAVDAARAAAFLREGNFPAALERLRRAGNRGQELGLLRALADAAAGERRFHAARMLTAEIAARLIQPEKPGRPAPESAKSLQGDEGASEAPNAQENQGSAPVILGDLSSAPGFKLALNALRARVLIFSGYIYVQNYARNVLGCPDPDALNLLDVSKLNTRVRDDHMMSICTFLANCSSMSGELMEADQSFLDQFERLDVIGEEKPVNRTSFIVSSTRPQLGRLSALNLTDSGKSGLFYGVSEQLVWLTLQQTGQGAIQQAAETKLAQLRLPGALRIIARQRAMVGRAQTIINSRMNQEQNSTPVECGQCINCGVQLEVVTNINGVCERQLKVAQELPPFAPVLGDACGRCGLPVIRSALSLKVLPLILVQPEEGVSEEQLVQAISGVSLGTDMNRDVSLEEFQSQLKASGVCGPSGMRVGLQVLRQTGAGRAHVVQGQGRRHVVLDVGRRLSAYCDRCQFFFAPEELEVAAVTTGKCPVCGGDIGV